MPPKYEYKTVAINGDGQVENILNSYGKDGWELVSASCMVVTINQNQHRYYFKRELRQDPQVDETEDIIPAMDKLKVDAEPPAPTPGVFTFGTPAPTPGVFAFGTPAPASENPPDADVTENEWPRVYRCTESMSGWNYDGSSKDKPHMVSDLFNERTYWIEFWEKITGRKRKDTICSYEGCTNRLLVGGHIWLSKQAGSPYKWCYIAPICQTCNNKRLEPDRELGSGSHLKKGTLVVRIRKPEEMDNLRVDTEPPSPTPGVFTFGTPAPTFEKPPDAGTEVDILRRDLDDLRTDFDKVRRKVGKTLGIGLITKEEQFEDIKRPNCGFIHDSNHCSFVGMTSKDYRAWKGEFDTYYREQQKQREKETEKLEEEQIAKDRLEAELQRVLKVEHEAEKVAKLKAYNEAEAKAQKKHFLETGEFISKSE